MNNLIYVLLHIIRIKCNKSVYIISSTVKIKITDHRRAHRARMRRKLAKLTQENHQFVLCPYVARYTAATKFMTVALDSIFKNRNIKHDTKGKRAASAQNFWNTFKTNKSKIYTDQIVTIQQSMIN